MQLLSRVVSFYDYDKICKSHVSAAVLERFSGYYELTVTVNTLEGKGNAFACDVPLGHGLNIVQTLMCVTVNTRPQLTTKFDNKDDDACGCGGAKRPLWNTLWLLTLDRGIPGILSVQEFGQTLMCDI